MGDYTVYITLTYVISAVGLVGLAFLSYRKMKEAERQAKSWRRRVKGRG